MRRFAPCLVVPAPLSQELDPNKVATIGFSDLTSPLTGDKSGKRVFCLYKEAMDSDSAMTSAATGKVYLVGAGPGDPELLTVKAQRLLASAAVVLHDDLVPQAILALAGPQAEVVSVGK